MLKVGDLVRLDTRWMKEREGKGIIPLGVVTNIYSETESIYGGHSVDVFWFDAGRVYEGENTSALVLLNES